MLDRIRRDAIYPFLRDGDTDVESAQTEIEGALDRIALSMQDAHARFYEAYTTLPQFREWLIEDVLQRTYQDYTTEKRDSVTIHADDPNAPDWVRATGDITITREGDTVTIDAADSKGEKSYVEFDIERRMLKPDKRNRNQPKKTGCGDGAFHRRTTLCHRQH
jgi:hypothetical protein